MSTKTETAQELFFRVSYLLDHGKRLGLLLGEAGSGKTRLLEEFRDEYSRRGHEVVSLDLSGKSISLLRELLAELDPNMKPVAQNIEPLECWKILSRLLVQKKAATPLLLLDHLERCDRSVIEELATLLRFHEVHEIARVFVLAVDANYLFTLDPRIANRVELKFAIE